MPKTLDDYFQDWEAETFGYGYGTGERPVIMALHNFLETCPAEGGYDYEKLEQEVTAPVAWLLINILCKPYIEILEYGTSPRFAWLTPEGQHLRAYVLSKTVDELLAVLDRDTDSGAKLCAPTYCNCDDGPCDNPFWISTTKNHQTTTTNYQISPSKP